MDVASPPAAKGEKPKTQVPVSTSAVEGLSTAQKLFFVGAIVGVCAIFLRSRGGKTSAGAVQFKEFKDRSMA